MGGIDSSSHTQEESTQTWYDASRTAADGNLGDQESGMAHTGTNLHKTNKDDTQQDDTNPITTELYEMKDSKGEEMRRQTGRKEEEGGEEYKEWRRGGKPTYKHTEVQCSSHMTH